MLHNRGQYTTCEKLDKQSTENQTPSSICHKIYQIHQCIWTESKTTNKTLPQDRSGTFHPVYPVGTGTPVPPHRRTGAAPRPDFTSDRGTNHVPGTSQIIIIVKDGSESTES